MSIILSLLFKRPCIFFPQRVFMANQQSRVKYQSLKSQLLRAWNLQLTTFTWDPKCDTDAYMTTLFKGKAWDLC